MKYEFGEFHLDAVTGRLLKAGVEIPLNNKAATVLRILVEAKGEIVRKNDIIGEVWSDRFVEECNLTQHVYILRKALGQSASQTTFIETIPKVGYRFNATVNEVTQNGIGNGHGDRSLVVRNEETDERDLRDSPICIREAKRSETEFTLRRITFVLLVCVLAAGVSWALYVFLGDQSAAQPAKLRSIAVLPFKPLEGSDDTERLGLGMADAVIAKLGRLQQIQVRPTGSVFDIAEKQMIDPVSAGRKLRVDTVLEGSFQRVEGRVRVTVHLISVGDEVTLWSESFNEDFADVFTVQDVIAERVAHALVANLNAEQKRLLGQRSTDSTEAYKAYILGTYFWNTRSRDGLPKAIDYFKRAVELDANYANAYAGLADSYAMMAYYGFGVPGEAFPLARQTAEKALALDGTVAEAYLALAQVQKHFEHDDDASRRSLEKAIELSPYNATARQRYAWQLVADKKIEPAVAEMRLAHEYNPVSPAINTALCQVLSFGHEYQEAAGYCKHANEIAPDSSMYQLEYADVLFFGGQVGEAIGKLENAALKNDQAYSLLVRLAYFYAKTGRRNEATKIYRELRSGASDDSRMLIQFANVAFALGEKEESYGLLLQASEKCAIPFEADYDPLFDDLRSIDPHRQIFLRYSC